MINKNKKRGFTLIELLIVIVIISILAGVLIALINPSAQQNRARDANVQAAINKAALASEGFRSAYGDVPNGAEFLASLDASFATAFDVNTCLAGTTHCTYSVVGVALSLACGATAATNWYGASPNASQCYFRYDTNGTDTFCIFAQSYGVPNTVFKYTNDDAAITQVTGASLPGCP